MTPCRLTLIWMVIIWLAQVLLCKFVFVQPGSGKFVLIKNRSVIFGFDGYITEHLSMYNYNLLVFTDCTVKNESLL